MSDKDYRCEQSLECKLHPRLQADCVKQTRLSLRTPLSDLTPLQVISDHPVTLVVDGL